MEVELSSSKRGASLEDGDIVRPSMRILAAAKSSGHKLTPYVEQIVW